MTFLLRLIFKILKSRLPFFLSAERFFFENPSKNMYLNFGEIGSNIKQLVESFTKQKSITQKVDSIQGI